MSTIDPVEDTALRNYSPVGRQPSCDHCPHERHTFFDCDWCLCTAHSPVGTLNLPPDWASTCEESQIE